MRSTLILSMMVLLSLPTVGQNNEVNESFVIQKKKELALPTITKQVFGDSKPLDSRQLIRTQDLIFDSLASWKASDITITDFLGRFIPKAENRKRFNSHLLSAEAGNRLNTQLNYQFINPLEQKRRIDFKINHRSFRSGPTNSTSSAQNGQLSSLSVIQPLNDWKLSLNSHFSRTAFNYFGAVDSFSSDSETLSSIESAVLWKSLHKLCISNFSNEKFTFKSDLIHQSTDQTKLASTAEQRFGLYSDLSGKVSKSIAWKFYPSVDYIVITPQLLGSDRLITQLPFVVHYSTGEWKIQAGLNWSYNRNAQQNSGNSYVLPQAVFSYGFGQLQSLQLGLRSNINLNTIFNASSENLYLNYFFQDYRTAIKQAEWFATYRHTLSEKHHFLIESSYSQIKDQAFFIENVLDSTSTISQEYAKYSYVYDDEAVGIMKIRITGNGDITKQLRYDFSLQGNRYLITNLESAFHMPTFQSNVGLLYDVNDKIQVVTQMRYESGIRFSERSESGQIANLVVQFDYQVNERLSSFISCNNILNQSNTRYYLYPSSPFLISVGLKALF